MTIEVYDHTNGQADIYNKMSEVSDGYHTFGELYEYRMLLQAAWFKLLKEKNGFNPVKSWRHHDGELCFGKDDYFIVVVQLPAGQISNHYKGKFWSLFDIDEVEKAPTYDGHTPAQAAERIRRYINDKSL